MSSECFLNICHKYCIGVKEMLLVSSKKSSIKSSAVSSIKFINSFNFANFFNSNFSNFLSSFLILFLVLCFLVPSVSASVVNYSKTGNQYSSITGSYITNSNCSGNCSWLYGNQIIVGSSSVSGGTATWTFNITQPLDKLQTVELIIDWPSITGKGLHSFTYPSSSTTSQVKVNSTVLSSPITYSSFKCYISDWYAFPCTTVSAKYTIPINLITASTSISITVPASTMWDIGSVGLIINYWTSNCGTNLDCGSDVWISGTNTCSGNNIMQKAKTFTCNNPGTASANCSSSEVLKLKQSCGAPTYESWGANYCNGKNIERSRVVHTPTCSAGGCVTTDSTEKQIIETCASCSNAVCIPSVEGVKIVNGKIRIDGNEFLIKGIDYAPWLYFQGPEPDDDPFPDKFDDVTYDVTDDAIRSVPDYSGDKKIQAWEVIKSDVETMKKLGVNTIRLYSSGGWHDKDLDGQIDYSYDDAKNEINQGDLPDWMLDEILTDAQANGMKVIIGYWVSEEDFKGTTPHVTNWDDLAVAKQSLGRVITKYKDNPALLAWGIGNEVNGIFNQGWFTWGVSTNDYLNLLFDYAKGIDNAHPIIYAKYIGENTNFNNMRADIISINAYTFSASELQSKGEFSISAPAGKAYMLGEFGHTITQAADQWNLAKQYAGGAFLEFNNVWWKGDGQYLLGVVDAHRNVIDPINIKRYTTLNTLYGGAPFCTANTDCQNKVVGLGPLTCNNTNDVFQSTLKFTCNNSGTTNANCTSTATFVFNKDCGETTYDAWSANYCDGNTVMKNRIVHKRGCLVGYCTDWGDKEWKTIQTCTRGCVEGACIEGTSAVKGKIRIDGTNFLVKGIDYSPWLAGQATDLFAGHKPYPNRDDDITALVKDVNGKTQITDYSGDGKIQAWEMIKYDISVMKKLGVNTIRTYSSGGWHDKDLDGVYDRSSNFDLDEWTQRDMPDWMIDEILLNANANGMKVIIGFWVSEENFVEKPPILNWNDLPIAKQSLGRIITKYKDNSAVLAWGIGNELNAPFYQGWFSWGVPVADYLNSLYDYAKSIDKMHPVMYGKYVGEDENFSSIKADIIAVNAFIHSANSLRGWSDFRASVPSDRAYLLGEFGQVIEQAQDQWNLAQQHAGGAFFEYSNVWWRGNNQEKSGVVDTSRTRNDSRYVKLNTLYGGVPLCYSNAECGTAPAPTLTCGTGGVVESTKKYVCNNAGQSSAYCSLNNSETIKQSCSYGCSPSTLTCLPKPNCSQDSDCGTNGLSPLTCSGNNVTRTNSTFTCQNPNTQSAKCVSNVINETIQSCSNGCSAGQCLLAPCGFTSQMNVSAETNAKTAWDIEKVELVVDTTAGSFTFSKKGNEFSSSSGANATKTSCGNVCSWISGDQVIVGVNNSDYTYWAGKVNWRFDLTGVDIKKITKLTVRVYQPANYLKGLHSPFTTGVGTLMLNGITLATLQTNKSVCTSDWFAMACSTASVSYSKTTSELNCTP
jgi:hypothetical protein